MWGGGNNELGWAVVATWDDSTVYVRDGRQEWVESDRNSGLCQSGEIFSVKNEWLGTVQN